jgi:polyisoprenoid-binding protein YceI
VGKAGLFSAASHEHWVSAPISAGELSDSGRQSVRFVVDARSMRVKPDQKVDAKDEAEIQDTMQRRVLESEKYPQVQFRSSNVSTLTEGSWKISGTLTLHGVTKPLSVDAKREGDAYTGNVTVKQTDFGIQPVSIAGGAVKVKNELEIHFEVYAISK